MASRHTGAAVEQKQRMYQTLQRPASREILLRAQLEAEATLALAVMWNEWRTFPRALSHLRGRQASLGTVLPASTACEVQGTRNEYVRCPVSVFIGRSLRSGDVVLWPFALIITLTFPHPSHWRLTLGRDRRGANRFE